MIIIRIFPVKYHFQLLVFANINLIKIFFIVACRGTDQKELAAPDQLVNEAYGNITAVKDEQGRLDIIITIMIYMGRRQ